MEMRLLGVASGGCQWSAETAAGIPLVWVLPSLRRRTESKLHVSMSDTTAIYERPPLPCRCRCPCVRFRGESLNVPLGVWLQQRLRPLAEPSYPPKWEGVIRGSALVSECWPPVATRLTRWSRQRSCCDKWWWGGSYVPAGGHWLHTFKNSLLLCLFPLTLQHCGSRWIHIRGSNVSTASFQTSCVL